MPRKSSRTPTSTELLFALEKRDRKVAFFLWQIEGWQASAGAATCAAMKRPSSFIRNVFVALLSLPLMAAAPAAEPGLSIRLAHDSPRERETAAQLQRLLQANDVSRWTFTRDIVIAERERPHSHPVLTLSTRHLRDDDLALSTFVHEQLHHFLDVHPVERAAAVKALRRLYPRIPVGYPDGSDDEAGNYDHLLIIYVEQFADVELMGELRAHAVMQFWAGDHYRWLYREMLRDPRKIGAIVKAQGLIPKG